MVPHQYQHSTWANEMGGSPVQGQLELQNETLSFKKEKKKAVSLVLPAL